MVRRLAGEKEACRKYRWAGRGDRCEGGDIDVKAGSNSEGSGEVCDWDGKCEGGGVMGCSRKAVQAFNPAASRNRKHANSRIRCG